MSAYPPALQRLTAYFSRLPGIGKRTAERLALSCMDWPEADLQGFAESLGTLRSRIRRCSICGNLSEEEICTICRDGQRHRNVICVVEQPSQLMVLENSGCFRGLYHVLGGKLSPLSGKGPEDLRIKELRARLVEGTVAELIVATSPDVEGEATAHYLAQEFADLPVRITRIASGVPIGSDLTYADAATLSIAMGSRRTLGE